MKETENINDLWICKKCGRFGYYHFYSHSIRLINIGKIIICEGKVVRFKTWLKGKK